MLRPRSRWWRRLLPRPAAKNRRTRYRPQLDPLEDRFAPAVFTVNTLADPNIAAGVNVTTGAINGTGGVVSLRSAIQAANKATDNANNVINLALAAPTRSPWRRPWPTRRITPRASSPSFPRARMAAA
jgi:hypothetical protein